MKDITLKFWCMPNAGFDTREITEQEIQIFKELYPHIDVSLKIISWARAWEHIVEAIKKKEGPDVLQIGDTWTDTLSYLGAILDISDRIKKKRHKKSQKKFILSHGFQI